VNWGHSPIPTNFSKKSWGLNRLLLVSPFGYASVKRIGAEIAFGIDIEGRDPDSDPVFDLDL
jgi:hypothetical protein